MSLSETTLVVMTKFPQAGRVKTRLMPALSGEQAAATHEAFLVHLCGRLARMEWGRRVICHDPPDCGPALRALVGRAFEYLPQGGGDLGARMAAAAVASSAAARTGDPGGALLFIGVDSPDVPTAALAAAARLVKTHDVVLGPSADGGYWSVALARRVDPVALLSRIEWSSGRELDQTLERARALGYNVARADAWPDVDYPPDLRRLVARLRASDDPADGALLGRLLAVLPARSVLLDDHDDDNAAGEGNAGADEDERDV
ncbi:MAG TPA: TIGR04282 family arsenosugar biosynthesis glycosyltransferase [Tepidisphaeraceae bacterium]|nr:TIGR04282 family arsenosugar biosynthesis glycosyltransferase [Tepidisphaeraceae bacterium]